MMDVENSKKTEEFLKDLEKTNKRLIEEIQNKANKKIKDRSDIFSTTITKLERQFPHLPKVNEKKKKEKKKEDFTNLITKTAGKNLTKGIERNTSKVKGNLEDKSLFGYRSCNVSSARRNPESYAICKERRQKRS